MEIINIKTQKLSFDKTNPELLKICEYIKLVSNKNGIDLLPTNPKFSLEFTLTNTNSAFANSLRKCLMDELEIFSLNVEYVDIDTDDKYILSDNLKKNIELIPIYQDKDYSKLQIKLNITNGTNEVLDIKSGDIEIYNGKTKLNSIDYFSTNITIAQLNPAHTLHVTKISVDKNISRKDYGKYAPLSSIKYEVLDIPKDLESSPTSSKSDSSKESDKTSNSLTITYKKFKIGYTTYRNIADPKYFIINACDILISRLTNILEEFKLISPQKGLEDSDIVIYYSLLIDIETNNSMYLVSLKNEYWTLGNAIAYSCYELDPTIPFITPSIIHPSTEIAVIKIIHKNMLKLMMDSITHLIKNYELVKSSFV